MIDSSKQGNTLFVWACVGLLGADLWLGRATWQHWEQSQAAESQIAELERTARQILELRDRPIKVETDLRTSDALARLVEEGAKQVGLKSEQIVQIDPGDPRRVAETEYLEQRTEVELREATLRQIVEFTIALEKTGKSLTVPQLSLRVPPGQETATGPQELWNAQLLLTSRIYEPKIPPPSLSKSP